MVKTPSSSSQVIRSGQVAPRDKADKVGTADRSAKPGNAKRVVVIYNPIAGMLKRHRLSRFLRHLKSHGYEVLLRRTEFAGHATELAAALNPTQVDFVFAAGGDGTINEVANGLIGSPIPMAIAPMGTANVFALELGQGLRMKAAAALVETGRIAEIRPATVNGRRFLLMTSAGPDARVVNAVGGLFKRTLGKLAYVIAGLKEIVSGRQTTIKLRVDGTSHEAGLAIVTHARHYGGPFIVAPDARLGDDGVTVILLKGTSRFARIRHSLGLMSNRLASLSDATVLHAKHVRIEGPTDEPIQLDGDHYGLAPVDIHQGDQVLRLLVPDLAEVRSLADLPKDIAGTSRDPTMDKASEPAL